MPPVSELMRHEIALAPSDATIRQVIEIMVDMDVEGVLITDTRGPVIGTIGDDQLVAALHAARQRPWWQQILAEGAAWSDGRLGTVAAADVMLRRVVVILPDTPAMTAIRLLDEYGSTVLPVADAGGKLLGALHRRDLVKWLLHPSPFGRPARS